jgi:hypothetical protein
MGSVKPGTSDRRARSSTRLFEAKDAVVTVEKWGRLGGWNGRCDGWSGTEAKLQCHGSVGYPDDICVTEVGLQNRILFPAAADQVILEGPDRPPRCAPCVN